MQRGAGEGMVSCASVFFALHFNIWTSFLKNYAWFIEQSEVLLSQSPSKRLCVFTRNFTRRALRRWVPCLKIKKEWQRNILPYPKRFRVFKIGLNVKLGPDLRRKHKHKHNKLMPLWGRPRHEHKRSAYVQWGYVDTSIKCSLIGWWLVLMPERPYWTKQRYTIKPLSRGHPFLSNSKNGCEAPLLTGHLPLPQGEPLNRGSTIRASKHKRNGRFKSIAIFWFQLAFLRR